MPRYKLLIEYDGAPYRGWQYQADAPSVQGAIEDAIARFDGQRVTIQGAGRTDAGVHALGQVAHCDLRSEHDGGTVRDALNFYLRPQPVAILAAERVSDDFNARFSATKRHYLYRVVNRRPDLALDLGRAWRVGRPLDIAAMREAATRLIGHHDFTTFRSTECQSKSPVKTLDQLDIETRRLERESHRLGALVPAQPGALDGRLAGPCRRGQVDAGRHRPHPRSARPHAVRAGGAARRAVSGEGGLLSFIPPRVAGEGAEPSARLRASSARYGEAGGVVHDATPPGGLRPATLPFQGRDQPKYRSRIFR